MLVLALWGCLRAVAEGEVRDGQGRPLHPAVVESAGQPCRVETETDGRFSLTCSPGRHRLRARAAGHMEEVLSAELEEGRTLHLPPVVLHQLPAVPGLFRRGPAGFVALERATLRREEREGPGAQRAYCLEGAGGQPVELPAAEVELLDHEHPGWRLFRLDPEGCAWREEREGELRWRQVWDGGMEAEALELGKGLRQIRLQLSAGDYFLADWDGYFRSVKGEGAARYGGHWLRAE